MKKLCVDIVVYNWDNETMVKCKGNGEFGEFWYDVAIALNTYKISGIPITAPHGVETACLYQDHVQGELCYKEMF